MSDDNPWAHYPNNTDAIKRHNELVLSSISTADLVKELASREGVKSYLAGSGDIADIRITYEYGGTGNEETKGPAKVIVVVD